LDERSTPLNDRSIGKETPAQRIILLDMDSLARQGAALSSDKELVEAFQRGDDRAFAYIYERYEPRIASLCRRMLRNPHDAEDAAQEAFAKAYAALGRFNGRYLVGSWLARIASNVCLDKLRSAGRAAQVVQLPEAADVESVEPDPELTLVHRIQINDVVASINPLHAQALKLRAVEDLTYDEMAGRLSMSPQQVKALLHRARVSARRAWVRLGAILVVPRFEAGERALSAAALAVAVTAIGPSAPADRLPVAPERSQVVSEARHVSARPSPRAVRPRRQAVARPKRTAKPRAEVAAQVVKSAPVAPVAEAPSHNGGVVDGVVDVAESVVDGARKGVDVVSETVDLVGDTAHGLLGGGPDR
jgi:RNA polymerase sigma-70 factor, ECF subfamily